VKILGISGSMFLTYELEKAGTRLEVLANEDSLGIYYLKIIYILGYRQFDDYKVMGLAPYGDPDTYRSLFKSFYTLLPEGAVAEWVQGRFEFGPRAVGRSPMWMEQQEFKPCQEKPTQNTGN
jgi:predicted NodU family carbamoyl transferase